MKISWTNAKKWLALSLIVPLFASVLVPFLSTGHASAADVSSIVWIDNDHTKAVDNNNNVYFFIGYVCPNTSSPIFSSSGSSIVISNEASPSDQTVQAFQDSETISSATTKPVPACANANGNLRAADSVWLSSGSTQFALVVYPKNNGTSPTNNSKICPIRSGNCTASVFSVNNNSIAGGVVFTPNRITVDTSKASVAATASAPVGSDGATVGETPTCEGSAGPLGWILCSVFNLMGETTQWVLHNIIQPFLVTAPLSIEPNSPDYQIWSSFRLYGNIFLIVALLVIVFGQSIGGGIVDAYTAKKVLPRLLVAAILINLSIYIVAIMIDITNIIGNGIGNLVTEPLRSCAAVQTPAEAATQSCWNFQISGGQVAGVFTVGLIGFIAGLSSIVGLIGGLFFAGGAGLTTGVIAGFFVILPMLLAVIAVFVTLLLRKGLILLLVLISPVAFALYALPNTEQYFRKWWDILLKTLLVYPIIMLVFAVSDILSVTILSANAVTPSNMTDTNWIASHAGSVLAIMMAFMAQFLPLFLIPFAFRIAGGILGRLHEAITGAGARIDGMAKSRREQAKHDFRAHSSQAQERAYDRFTDRASRGNALTRRGFGILARRAGGYNIKADRAKYNAEQQQAMQAQNDTGDDTEMRALSVNKQWALSRGVEGTDWKRNDDGTRSFRTLGGAWVSEGAVDRAQARWGGNQSALQWSIGHEMEKALTQEEQDYMKNNYGNVVGEGSGWNMSAGQRAGVWVGAAFAKQNVNREWKHYKVSDDGHLVMDTGNALSMMREVDEKKGAYEMSQNNADTWTTMGQAMVEAKQVLDTGGANISDPTARAVAIAQAQETLERGARIAHSLRSASMGGVPIPGEGGDFSQPQSIQAPTQAQVQAAQAQQASQQQGSTAAPVRIVGAGAAGRVQEEMNRFVALADASAGIYTPPEPLVGEREAPVRPAAGSMDTIDTRESDRPGSATSKDGSGGTGPRIDFQ